MVKVGKWFRNILTGKKEKNQDVIEKIVWLQLPPPPPPPPTTPKEKMGGFNQEMEKYNPKDQLTFFYVPALEQRRHSIPAASATEAAVYLARAAGRKSRFAPIEEIAAIKIQSSFRSHLARKALRALKALVKLQAVVRGFLVRKQAAATMRSMQALLTAQVRARAQRAQTTEVVQAMPWTERKREMMNEYNLQQLHDMEKNVEINGQSKGSSKSRKSNQFSHINETKERRNSSNLKPSSGPSVLTDMSSGTRSARFDEYSTLSSGTRSARFDEYSSFTAAKYNSQLSSAASHKPGRTSYSEELVRLEEPLLISHESPLYPNYMAKTESWRAKARSQSAPRQMPESIERKLSGKQRGFSVRGAARKDQLQWYNELDRTATIQTTTDP